MYRIIDRRFKFNYGISKELVIDVAEMKDVRTYFKKLLMEEYDFDDDYEDIKDDVNNYIKMAKEGDGQIILEKINDSQSKNDYKSVVNIELQDIDYGSKRALLEEKYALMKRLDQVNMKLIEMKLRGEK